MVYSFKNFKNFYNLDILDAKHKVGYLVIDTTAGWHDFTWNYERGDELPPNIMLDIYNFFEYLTVERFPDSPKYLWNFVASKAFKDSDGYQAIYESKHTVFVIRVYADVKKKVFVNCFSR